MSCRLGMFFIFKIVIILMLIYGNLFVIFTSTFAALQPQAVQSYSSELENIWTILSLSKFSRSSASFLVRPLTLPVAFALHIRLMG